MPMAVRRIPSHEESPRTTRSYETLREYLVRHGPATAEELRAILSLSRAATYEVVRKAANGGLIHAVAHVHSDGNRDPRAWDIDSADPEFVWRRRERLRGRFCTCLARRAKARVASPA